MTLLILGLLAIVGVLIWAVLASQRDLKRITSDMEKDVEARFEKWRQSEIETVRQAAQEDANRQLALWKGEQERSIRQNAILRSQSVINGKVVEQLAPYLPEFPYDPRDVRFIGSPIDLIIFNGLNDGGLQEIVFVEVKTGSSALSKRERSVRDCLQHSRVTWKSWSPSH